MRNFSTRIRLGGAVLFLCMTAPLALADSVNMTITQPLYDWAGVNISPYSATITSPAPTSNLSVVCLDIAENTYLNTGYSYDRTYNGGPSGVGAITPATKEMYDGAARLAAQLLATPTPLGDVRGKLSFAIWYIFDTAAFTHANSYITAPMKAEIIGMAAAAVADTTSVSYTVYTPTVRDTTGLASQRMLGNVTVPEPSAVALLGLNLSGLLGLVVVLRRRRLARD